MTIISVVTFEDLPSAAQNNGNIASVAQSGPNAHRGYYMSNGTAWTPANSQPDHLRRIIVELAQQIPVDMDSLDEGQISKIFTEAMRDTLRELAAAMGNDPNFAGTITAALSNKVDKVTGKGLSENDFTTALRNKLNALPAADVITSLITDLSNRVAALESWSAKIKAKKLEGFNVVTNASGDFTVTTSVVFTNPVILAAAHGTALAEGLHCHISTITNNANNIVIQGRAFRNKTQGVLVGGVIDPDNPAANAHVYCLVIEP